MSCIGRIVVLAIKVLAIKIIASLGHQRSPKNPNL